MNSVSTSVGQPQNGIGDGDRLSTLLEQLQAECDQLRKRLQEAEADRDRYLKALYEHARAEREFEDVDIDTLRATSAGPVEMIEG